MRCLLDEFLKLSVLRGLQQLYGKDADVHVRMVREKREAMISPDLVPTMRRLEYLLRLSSQKGVNRMILASTFCVTDLNPGNASAYGIKHMRCSICGKPFYEGQPAYWLYVDHLETTMVVHADLDSCQEWVESEDLRRAVRT